MLGHSLPPSEIKSLYGSITRSAVISFSYVTFAMLPPGNAVTQVDQRLLLRWRCQRLSPSTERIAHLSRQGTAAPRGGGQYGLFGSGSLTEVGRTQRRFG